MQDIITFLKNISPKEFDTICEKLRLSYVYRRSLKGQILEIFPRFLDTPGLV